MNFDRHCPILEQERDEESAGRAKNSRRVREDLGECHGGDLLAEPAAFVVPLHQLNCKDLRVLRCGLPSTNSLGILGLQEVLGEWGRD